MKYEMKERVKDNLIVIGDYDPIISIITHVIGSKRLDYVFKIMKGYIHIEEFFVPILIYIMDIYINDRDKYLEWLSKNPGREYISLVPKVPAKYAYAFKAFLENDTFYINVKNHDLTKSDLDLKLISKTLNWKPLEHQEKAFQVHTHMKKAFGLRGMYIDGSIGSGKTILSLMLAIAQDADHVVIMCPNNAVEEVWKKTLTTSGAFKKEQDVWTVQDKTKYDKSKYLIANFESIGKLREILPDLKGKVVYIVDEAHNLNESKTVVSETVQEYVLDNEPYDIILMSGTPIKMHSKEIIPIMTILDPRFTASVKENYIKLFRRSPRALVYLIPEIYAKYRVMVRRHTPKAFEPTEEEISIIVKDEDRFYISTIRTKMKEYIKKRVKEDEPLLDGYNKEYIKLRNMAFKKSGTPRSDFDNYILNVDVIKESYVNGGLMMITDIMTSVKKYDKEVIEPNLDSLDRQRFRIVRTYFKYPMLKYIGEALGVIVTQARIEASIAIVDELDTSTIIQNARKKTLFMSNYVKVATRVMDNEKKYGGIPIFGEHTNNIPKSLKDFEEDDSLDYISATYKSLGTAVPVIMCSTFVAIEKPFRTYLWDQAKGRVDREGQDGSTKIVTLYMDTKEEPNIYNRTDDLLQQSLFNVTFLTSGTNEALDGGTDIQKEIIHGELKAVREIYTLSIRDELVKGFKGVYNYLTGESFTPKPRVKNDLLGILVQLKNGKYLTKRKTYIELFTIPLKSTNLCKQVNNMWVIEVDGLSYNTNRSIEETPLSFNMPLNAYKGSLSIIKEDIDTTVGRFILNYIMFEYGLSGKFNYINEQFSYTSKTVEPKIIKGIIANNSGDENAINLDDYKRIAKVNSFIRSLSQILVVSSTEDNVYPPKEFFDMRSKTRKDLASKHGKDWANDKFLMLEYENIMVNYVKELYKDDPSYGITLDKKSLGSFKTKYISIGVAQKMSKESKDYNEPRSLEEGYTTNKDSFTAMNNSIRFGSAARANSTVFAGVITKHIVTAIQSFMITIDDCKTKKLYPMVVREEFLEALTFLHVSFNGKELSSDIDLLRKYVGKIVYLRLPLYCTSEGDTYCKKCVGKMVSVNPKSIPHLFIKISGDGTQYQLSKFHATVLEVKTFDYDDLF